MLNLIPPLVVMYCMFKYDVSGSTGRPKVIKTAKCSFYEGPGIYFEASTILRLLFWREKKIQLIQSHTNLYYVFVVEASCCEPGFPVEISDRAEFRLRLKLSSCIRTSFYEDLFRKTGLKSQETKKSKGHTRT